MNPATTEDIKALYALYGIRSSGPRVVENLLFEKEKLAFLDLGPGVPPHSIVRLANCIFRNCAVAGPFGAAAGVAIENVIFDNITSPDLLTIYTPTVLRNVVVKGSSKTRGLWVKPDDFDENEQQARLYRDWAASASQDIDCMIDFSEFHGKETEVVGLPLSKLKWNPEYHVPVLWEWKSSAAWKQLDLPPTSYWNLRMLRLKTFNATEGVYSLPSQKNSKYLQTKEEMARLIDVGLLPRS